jgi:hypothetical protein
MNLANKIVVPAEVMARQVGEEIVILDLNSGTYFGLDPVGARIWALLSEGKSIGEACEILLEEYEVDVSQLEQDITKLVSELVEKKLVTLEP